MRCIDLEGLVLTIAENIRNERKLKNMSQMELAEKSDLSLDMIKSVEAGRRMVSIENFNRIAESLEVPAYMLMKEETDFLERMQRILQGKTENEVEWILYMAEHMIEGHQKFELQK